MFENFTRDNPRGARPGTTVRSGSQTFTVVATQVWDDGATAKPMGLVWRSNCASCGTEFFQHSPTHPEGLLENCPFCTSDRYDRHDYIAPKAAPRVSPVKRRGRIENHVLEVAYTYGNETSVGAVDLIDRAASMLSAPEKGKRDTRRQMVARALHNLSKEKGGPLQLAGGKVILLD